MGFPRLKPTSLAWQVEFFHWAIREGHDKPRQHILKSRDITLPRKVCTTSQSCYFSSGYVQIWELDHQEGWMPKIDAFELWCWKRLLRVPWTTRRPNQSILKEISPKYSLEGLMLKLKLQNFGYLLRRTGSLEKTLMLGKIEGRRRRGWQRLRVDGHELEQAPGVAGQGSLACCSPCSYRVRHDWVTELRIISLFLTTSLKK